MYIYARFAVMNIYIDMIRVPLPRYQLNGLYPVQPHLITATLYTHRARATATAAACRQFSAARTKPHLHTWGAFVYCKYNIICGAVIVLYRKAYHQPHDAASRGRNIWTDLPSMGASSYSTIRTSYEYIADASRPRRAS